MSEQHHTVEIKGAGGVALRSLTIIGDGKPEVFIPLDGAGRAVTHHHHFHINTDATRSGFTQREQRTFVNKRTHRIIFEGETEESVTVVIKPKETE